MRRGMFSSHPRERGGKKERKNKNRFPNWIGTAIKRWKVGGERVFETYFANSRPSLFAANFRPLLLLFDIKNRFNSIVANLQTSQQSFCCSPSKNLEIIRQRSPPCCCCCCSVIDHPSIRRREEKREEGKKRGAGESFLLAVSTWTIRGRFYRGGWSKCTSSRVFRKTIWRNPDVVMFPAGELLSFSVHSRAAGVTREADTPLSLFNRSRSKIARPG